MATNSERPRRFDLRTTIPLATETLVRLAKQPKRSWVVPGLTLITGIALGFLMLELLVYPGPITALAFEGELRSRLSANYGADPVVAKIHELRLTIVEDVLGLEEGNGSEPPAIAILLRDPVPTATPKATAKASPISPSEEPTAFKVPTDAPATETSMPEPSDTPLPSTEVVVVTGYCSNLSIISMEVDGDDVEARIRNDGSKNVYLIKTVFEWSDVPDPAYLDWFEFDGDRYYHSHDWDSPTVSTGDHERLRRERTRKWETDFDDVPDDKVYGSFSVTLTFDVPDQDAHCSIGRSTSKAPPAPTAELTSTPVPTDTPEPAPTDTPELIPTDTPEPAPTNTPAPTETPTPEPTATP